MPSFLLRLNGCCVAFGTPGLVWLTLEAQASHTVALLASWERACAFITREIPTQAPEKRWGAAENGPSTK